MCSHWPVSRQCRSKAMSCEIARMSAWSSMRNPPGYEMQEHYARVRSQSHLRLLAQIFGVKPFLTALRVRDADPHSCATHVYVSSACFLLFDLPDAFPYLTTLRKLSLAASSGAWRSEKRSMRCADAVPRTECTSIQARGRAVRAETCTHSWLGVHS